MRTAHPGNTVTLSNKPVSLDAALTQTAQVVSPAKTTHVLKHAAQAASAQVVRSVMPPVYANNHPSKLTPVKLTVTAPPA